MITEIGIVAGDIWHYLDEKGVATLDQLAKGTKQPKELILMSLGWLAREGHIVLESSASNFSAKLVEPKKAK
ncbi:winged helix-turn-helix domain-containing protein [Omnitrophica bacterium]|nr:winged helix-turn-helix domain-containing protein [Candidatus Omnitrophota bacterium]